MDVCKSGAVVCLGALSCDVYLKNIPQTLMQTDTTFARDVTLRIGGGTGAVAANLARMGLGVRLVSRLGGDVFGTFICSTLKDSGVNTDTVACEGDGASATNLAFFDLDGVPHKAHFAGNTAAITPDAVDDTLLAGADFLCIELCEALPLFDKNTLSALLQRAAKNNTRILAFAHGNMSAAADMVRLIAPQCMLLTLDKAAADAVGGNAAGAIHALAGNAPQLLTVLDNRDVVASNFNGLDGRFPLPAVCSDDPCDPAGMVEALFSGCTAALLRGLDAHECVALGAAAAAVCLHSEGACHWGTDFDSLRAAAQ